MIFERRVLYNFIASEFCNLGAFENIFHSYNLIDINLNGLNCLTIFTFRIRNYFWPKQSFDLKLFLTRIFKHMF